MEKYLILLICAFVATQAQEHHYCRKFCFGMRWIELFWRCDYIRAIGANNWIRSLL